MQAVIIRMVYVRQLVNLRKVREPCVERPGRLFGSPVGRAVAIGSLSEIVQADVGWGPDGRGTGSRTCRWVTPPGAQGRLVDVSETQEFCSMVANIRHLQGGVIGKGPLNGERPRAGVAGTQ